jgi:hypothetical protein
MPRMHGKVRPDAAPGAIRFAGDVGDFFCRPDSRNLTIVHRHQDMPTPAGASSTPGTGAAPRYDARMRQTFVLLVICALAACGSNDPGPAGVTASEAQALSQAGEMLEQRQLPAGALHPAASHPATLAPAASAAP